MWFKREPWSPRHEYLSTHTAPHSDTLSTPFHRWEKPRPTEVKWVAQGHTASQRQPELKSRTRTVSSLEFCLIIHQQLQVAVFIFPEGIRLWIINKSIVLRTESPKGNWVQDASAFKMQLKCCTFLGTDVMELTILRQTQAMLLWWAETITQTKDCRIKDQEGEMESLGVHCCRCCCC